MNFFRKITGQLILEAVIMIASVLFFSIYAFNVLATISFVETGTLTISRIPATFYSIQSLLLNESNLLFSYRHDFISKEDFLLQIENIDKKEVVQLENMYVINQGLKNIASLNEEEVLFNEEFDNSLNSISYNLTAVEENIQKVVQAHESQNDALETEIRNEINVTQFKIENEMTSLDSWVNNIIKKRHLYLENIISDLLKKAFVFVCFLFIVIIGLNIYLVIQTVFSLRFILKGIEENKKGNFSYRIQLNTQSEFGTIAQSLNNTSMIIEEKNAELQKTIKLLQEQSQSLIEKNSRLEQFQEITVDRELRMIELKKEIEDLKKNHGIS